MIIDDPDLEEQPISILKLNLIILLYSLQVKITTHKMAGLAINPSEPRKRTKLTAQKSTSQKTPFGLTGVVFAGTVLPSPSLCDEAVVCQICLGLPLNVPG
jgi:hypothetical protein